MGPGFAGLHVDGDGSDRQTFPHPGTLLHTSDSPRRCAQSYPSHRGYGDRGRARHKSEALARYVPVFREEKATKQSFYVPELARLLSIKAVLSGRVILTIG